MTLIEKLEKQAEEQESYPSEYALQFAYKYGWVTNALQYKIESLENAFKDFQNDIKDILK